jgi:hypothetical protein
LSEGESYHLKAEPGTDVAHDGYPFTNGLFRACKEPDTNNHTLSNVLFIAFALLCGVRCPFIRFRARQREAPASSLRTAHSPQNAARCTSILFFHIKLHGRLFSRRIREEISRQGKKHPLHDYRVLHTECLCLGLFFDLLLHHIPFFFSSDFSQGRAGTTHGQRLKRTLML